jgi:hypothetical protein
MYSDPADITLSSTYTILHAVGPGPVDVVKIIGIPLREYPKPPVCHIKKNAAN